MNEVRTLDQNTIAKLVINGDLKGLTDAQKVEYYSYRCQQAGLDPAAKPFDLLTLNGKMILYANAGATQQLTSIHKLSHYITGKELVDGIYCVFCKVTGPDGRTTENMGAVTVEGLKGENKANAMLKATTKAIRRSVLAHMGLGLMDETEVETIPDAKTQSMPTTTTLQGEVIDTTITSNGWDTDAEDEFVLSMDRAYQAFKAAGQLDKYEPFAAKWKANKASDPAEKVLTALAAFVGKLEAAALKKTA